MKNITKKIVNNFGESIVRVDGDIPIDLPAKDGDRFLFISHDQSFLTHGLHKYPAKFFPELPRWLIKRYSQENDWILDPFAGSGTTNVEALLSRRHSVGIDVDPFSRFISKVKVTPLVEKELKSSQKILLEAILDYRPSLVAESDLPDFPYRDNWFNKEILLELTYLKKRIQELDSYDAVKDFFKVCLSSIIRAVSNADDNCTRTVIRKKLKKLVRPSDALNRFVKALHVKVPKMIAFSQNYPKGITTDFPADMDARNIKYKANYFDIAVTSPPYVNAVDYPRTHQLEMYWLGFAQDSLTALKKQNVGTESVSAVHYKVRHEIGGPEADRVIANIFENDPRRAYIAFKYLDDMRKNLTEVYKVLREGGRYVIVVGNNRIRGQLFENWKYLMPIAEDIGFEIETYFGSEIIKHFLKMPRKERIHTDWILVLKK
ncbi:MAG: DNA methyltransferase [Candidatus Poribacteria bacterium]|nr:DNA methyltransferase [Candidatus Poribacteria bacterium]